MNDSNLCLQLARQSNALPRINVFILFVVISKPLWVYIHAYFFPSLMYFFSLLFYVDSLISHFHCYFHFSHICVFSCWYNENENLIKFCYVKLISHMSNTWINFIFQTSLRLKFWTCLWIIKRVWGNRELFHY